MSYAGTLPSRHAVAFEPSHVTHDGPLASPSGNLMPVSLMRLLAAARPVAAAGFGTFLGKLAGEVVAKLVVAEPVAAAIPPLSAAEMAQRLREAGLSVSGLAEMMGVERKTVYAWLDGSDARNANLGRLETLHGLLGGEQPGALKLFHRHWDRSMEGGATLHGLLTAEAIDVGRVRAALDALRPSITRALEREHKQEAEGWMDGGPPGLMNLHMVATLRR